MRNCIKFVLLIICVQACSNGLQKQMIDESGVSYSFQTNDQGQKVGEQIVKDPNGTIIEKSNYKSGKLEGRRIIFFDNGKPELIEQYIDDKLEGPYKAYYEDGSLKYEVNYSDNVMSGLFTQYYPGGLKKEEVHFVDNEENGAFVEYHENGNIKWEGTYRNGDNEVGELLEYNIDGELIKKKMCDDNSVCRTIWTLEKGTITSDNN